MALVGQIVICCAFLVAPAVAACSDGECKADDMQALLQTRARERTAEHIVADLKAGKYTLDESVKRKNTWVNSRYVNWQDTYYARRDAVKMTLGTVARCRGSCLSDYFQSLDLEVGFSPPVTDILFNANNGSNIVVSPLIVLDDESQAAFNAKIDVQAIPNIVPKGMKGAKVIRNLVKKFDKGGGSADVNISSLSKTTVGFQEIRFDALADPTFAHAVYNAYKDQGISSGRIRVITAVLIAVTPLNNVASTCETGNIGAEIPQGAVNFGGSTCHKSSWSMPTGGLFAYETSYINGDWQFTASGYSLASKLEHAEEEVSEEK